MNIEKLIKEKENELREQIKRNTTIRFPSYEAILYEALRELVILEKSYNEKGQPIIPPGLW